jgi:hypothetical protein
MKKKNAVPSSHTLRLLSLERFQELQYILHVHGGCQQLLRLPLSAKKLFCYTSGEFSLANNILSKTLVLSSKTVALQFLSEENSVNSQKASLAALTNSRNPLEDRRKAGKDLTPT